MNQTDDKLDVLSRELSEFRQTMRADFTEVRQEMDAKSALVNAKLVDAREEMRVGFATVEAGAAQRHADFIKWTMDFWAVSLVTYIGALVRTRESALVASPALVRAALPKERTTG